MTKMEYKSRLSVEITEEQRKELVRLIPWGVKSQLFSVIIDDVIGMIKKHGTMYIAAVLDRSLNLEDYTSLDSGFGDKIPKVDE
ncbi:unnamed protein product [marine sediment metagenome]|uniref:Uncharacterized protein n=1 Tax=marine sediment metagenome TaxID=412755 RepID=X0U8F2_9ZZZZ